MIDYLDQDGLDTLIRNIKSKDDDLSTKIDGVKESSLTGVRVNGTLVEVTDRIADITVDSENSGNSVGGVYFGDCTTQPNHQTKEVKCSGLTEITDGVAIFVNFSDASAIDSPKLNVNGNGEQGIAVGESDSHSLMWDAGTSILFIYSREHDDWWATGFRDTYLFTCNAAADAVRKHLTIRGNFVLLNGTEVIVQFTYANTAESPTLGENEFAYFPIIGDTNWNAGDYVRFVFDGEQFIVLSDGENSNASYDESTETLTL